MPWTINSEIYPLWARSTGNACAAGVNWTFNILVSVTFLHLAQYLTYYGQFLGGLQKNQIAIYSGFFLWKEEKNGRFVKGNLNKSVCQEPSRSSPYVKT